MKKLTSLSQFCENPDNPQTVTEEAFADLVKSIERDERNLEFRKIAYVTDYVALSGESFAGRGVVLDGNKRLRALKKIHGEDGAVPASYFFDITSMSQDERKRWLVRANIQTGEWDAEALAKLYSAEELSDITSDSALAELLAGVAPSGEGGGEGGEDEINTGTSFHYHAQYGVIVMCKDEAEQEKVYNRLASEGFECKVVTT